MSIAGGLFQGKGQRNDEDEPGSGASPPEHGGWQGIDIDLDSGQLVLPTRPAKAKVEPDPKSDPGSAPE